MTNTDGITEAMDGATRVALTIAAQVGQRLARIYRELLEASRARNEQQARELEARLDAQRAAARTELRPVQSDDWWDRASVADIARAHEVATTWAEMDPDARAAAERVRTEVQERYGFDPAEMGRATPAILDATRVEAESRAVAAAERSRASEDMAEAQILMAESVGLQQLADEQRGAADETEQGIDWDRGDPLDLAQFEEAQKSRDAAAENDELAGGKEEQGYALYDSADRRRAFAEHMETRGSSAEDVKKRIVADVNQARHPSEAVTSTRKSPKPKKSKVNLDQGRKRSDRTR